VNGNQCDNCRKFGVHPAGWLYLVQHPEQPSSFMSSLFPQPADPLTFCSMRCVAEYAYVQAVAKDAATGTEPG
jgi:hypothetical protein